MIEEEIKKIVDAAVDAKLKSYFGFNDVLMDGGNLANMQRLAATLDSALYVQKHMADVAVFGGATSLLSHALRQSRLKGLILEFGVFSGLTINHIASETDNMVYGFDSFEGLPEDWRPDIQKGTFATSIPAVHSNVELVVGYFDATLPNFMKEHPGDISILHIDCDLYSSTRTIFEHCEHAIRSGTIIIFDEYFNYVGFRNHEYKAFQEFIDRTGKRYKYIGYVPWHQQVAVEIL